MHEQKASWNHIFSGFPRAQFKTQKFLTNFITLLALIRLSFLPTQLLRYQRRDYGFHGDKYMCEGRALTLAVRSTWVQIPAPALPSCVTLSQLLSISMPQPSHAYIINTYLLQYAYNEFGYSECSKTCIYLNHI